MAAEKPIVSTPITDVAEPYGDIVYLGDDIRTFQAACEQALSASAEEREGRFVRMREVLAGTSWEATAEAMSLFLDKITCSKQVHHEHALVTRAAPVEGTPPVVIIGGGPTGLSAAYHLGANSLLLERNNRVGGWCRSIEKNGFTFDFAGHIMFSNDPYVHQMYEKLLGDNVHWQDREAWIYSKNVYTRYPFQGSLYGLPPQVIKECILGAIEARFGSAAATPEKNACKNGTHHERHNGQAKKNGTINDCCADGIMESTARLGRVLSKNGDAAAAAAPENFEDFIYKVWGAGIAKHFAIPYNRKLWAVPLNEMETSWLGGRVPMPDLGEMIEGACRPLPSPWDPTRASVIPCVGVSRR